MDSIHSVHALVRLLKSPTDPPSSPGPCKIEIARIAWSDPSFHAASKGEIIGEWILTLLGQAKKTRRERDTNSTFDPIADSRYWSLLCEVLVSPSANARPIKSWLLPLLNRLQLDTIVIELLAARSHQVLCPARAALATLWPLAERRIGVDALAECLDAVFKACAECEQMDDGLSWICSTVVGAYRNALANAGNKKKLYISFLTRHLSSWLHLNCTSSSVLPPSSANQLQDSIYAAGTDTLFSLDALKQPLDTLFDALSTSSLPLSIFPKLFASFLAATHKHRSALFVSANSAIGGKEEVRKRGMEFVGKFWTLTKDSVSTQVGFDLEKWKSILGVFEIVGRERLFLTPSIRNTHLDAADSEHGGELALSEARDTAIEILKGIDVSSGGYWVEQAVLSIQLLDVLIRIEYNFIGAALEKILSIFISFPPTLFHIVETSSSEFLARVLEYHTKTRTIHTYVLTLLDAIVASPFVSRTSSSLSVTGKFPLAHHLPNLGHVLRISLTPTQIAPLTTAALLAVESAWKAVKDAVQRGKVAKEHVVGEVNSNLHSAETVSAQAQAFSYTSRVAGTILSNLPSNSYTKDGEHALESLWSDAGKLGWAIIWDCLKERTEWDEGHKERGSKGKRRCAHEMDPSFGHYPHIVTSAALRFLYDIRTRLASPLGDCDQLKEQNVETLLNVVQNGVLEPELGLEIIRTLFWNLWYTHNRERQKRMEAQLIFNVTLGILATHISSKAEWSGVSADLTHDNLGLAVLYILTDRWIDVLDEQASTESLERFISPLLTMFLDLPDEDIEEASDMTNLQRGHVPITFRGVFLKLLQNAHFWELHNIRAVFLLHILNTTAPLSFDCFPPTGVKLPSPATIPEAGLTLACGVYRFLYHVPLEYFTRSARAELVKRAMAGDVLICTTKLTTATEELKNWSRQLTFIRAFLQRMGPFLNVTNHATSSAYVNHLLDLTCTAFPSNALTSITLELIRLHIGNLLRSQEPGAVSSISSVVSTIIAAEPFSRPSSLERWTHVVVQSSVLDLVGRLSGDIDPASLPDRVRHLLKTLLETLESALSLKMQRSVARDGHLLSSEQINAWSGVLSLARQLGINSQAISIPFGLKLVVSTCYGQDAKTCSSVIRLLFEELVCIPDISHRVHLDMLTGFYVVNMGHQGSDLNYAVDTNITQGSKKLSVKDYSYLLEVLAEGVGGSKLQTCHRECLIHLAKVILHNAPQGTLKVVQTFVTQCFGLFADREDIYRGPSTLKMQSLEFIARHCFDRPIAIRSVDLGNIWSLLNKILYGSPEHDPTTTFPIFHHVVTIISTLIRLRRDLVVHNLPHVCHILRQLMMLTRTIRPQLGAKQSKIVIDTFPSWLSPSQPLSTDEARALARLLTSLTSKTVPRTYANMHPQTSIESHKAESLAKPFAKYAMYVLVAYVDAFNDPLCIINAEMRRELEPGLFALCEMVGEHSRDALMVSALDSGGKTIMKSLWMDYERQRYVGKG